MSRWCTCTHGCDAEHTPDPIKCKADPRNNYHDGKAMGSAIETAIKALESCEAKLEYMGAHRVGTRDAPDCLHRAAKARNAVAALRSEFLHQPKK